MGSHMMLEQYYEGCSTPQRVRQQLLVVVVDIQSQLLRMVLSEGARVENHLLNIACHAADAGSLVALLSSI